MIAPPQDTALNGAQIASLLAVVDSIAAGKLFDGVRPSTDPSAILRTPPTPAPSEPAPRTA